MRELNLQEEKLLEELISRSNIKIPSNWKNDLLVSPLHDGKMGSLCGGSCFAAICWFLA